MFTKRIWLLIGALTILSAGVVGVSAYFSKKTIPNVCVFEGENTKEFTSTMPIEEITTSATAEFTSTELKEMCATSQIEKEISETVVDMVSHNHSLIVLSKYTMKRRIKI